MKWVLPCTCISNEIIYLSEFAQEITDLWQTQFQVWWKRYKWNNCQRIVQQLPRWKGWRAVNWRNCQKSDWKWWCKRYIYSNESLLWNSTELNWGFDFVHMEKTGQSVDKLSMRKLTNKN